MGSKKVTHNTEVERQNTLGNYLVTRITFWGVVEGFFAYIVITLLIFWVSKKATRVTFWKGC